MKRKINSDAAPGAWFATGVFALALGFAAAPCNRFVPMRRQDGV